MYKNDYMKKMVEETSPYFGGAVMGYYAKERGETLDSFSEDDFKSIISGYFSCSTLTEANNYLYDSVDRYVKDTYDLIDWNNENSPEYLQWKKHSRVLCAFSDACRLCKLQEKWVELNGMVRTNEDAAKMAAEKWCSLLFDFHVQDNGARQDSEVMMCCIGTSLHSMCNERITEEMKEKTFNLLYEYYLHYLHYNDTNDKSDIEWLEENLHDGRNREYRIDWKEFGFCDRLYCDYNPNCALYCILSNAGIPENCINSICPWKTGISIRTMDNTIKYYTYGNIDEF